MGTRHRVSIGVMLVSLLLVGGLALDRPPYQQLLPAVLSHAPPCAIDWTLPMSYDNLQVILACHRLVSPQSVLCPPAGSPWEPVFNNSLCWSINHGTPAALTATALGPPTLTPGPPYPVP